MKFFIALALLGAALASTHLDRYFSIERNIQESSFRAGREYRYLFNGQLSAGLPVPSTPQGISRLQSQVTLQWTDGNTVRMQLQKTRFATSQQESNSMKMLPFERFEEVERMNREHQELLSMPVEFDYEHGLVREIRFAENDQPWSENIKRAVINMLQVNILKKEKYEGAEKSDNQEPTFSFTNVERTLEGECEVLYTVEEIKKEDKQRWAKSINLDKCTRRPYIHHVQTPVCKDCQQTLEQDKMSSTVLNYNITGTSSSFLINSVELRSQHLFAPISEKHQLVSAFTLNTMELIYAGEKKTEIKQVRNEKTSELVYNQESEWAEQQWAQTGEEKYLRQLPQWTENKVEMIKKMFSLMAKQIEQGEAELEAPHTVARIVKVLRECNEEQLEQIYRHVAEHKDEKIAEQLRSIYFNTLRLAGTRVTIQQFVDKVQSRKNIAPLKASVAIKTLVDMRYPSLAIAEDIARLCESDVSSSFPALRQSCWLTYGAIVNGVCGQTPRVFVQKNGVKMCPRDAKQRIVDKLVQQFESASTRYEKVLALKTLANAGLDLSVYPLEKIILNEQHETTIRTQAIESFRRLRTQMPTKIQRVLMPVYLNRQQPQHIRMSALHQIIYTQPEWSVLSQIGNQLRQERDQQVRAFTLSLLRSYANNESPCEQTFSSRVQSLLNNIPFSSQEIDRFESVYGKWSTYSRRHQSGFEANFASLFTTESVLPTEMMASIEGVLSGEWNQYFAQIGFTQKNMEKIIKKLLSNVQEKGLEQIVVRGKRASGSFQPTEFLSNLLEKLRITRRQSSEQDPHAFVYIRHRDMDYAFLPIDADSIPEVVRSMIQGGRLEIGDIERVLAQGIHFSASNAAFLYETVRRVPTPMGLPVQFTSKMPTISSIRGQVTFELEPKNGKSFDGLRLRVQAGPRVASTHVLSLRVICPIAEVGTKFLHQAVLNTPVDTEIRMNWEDKVVIRAIYNTPSEEKRIAMIQSRPVTFTRTVAPDARQYPEPIEMTYMLPAHKQLSQSLDREYPQIRVQGTLNRPTSVRIPQWIVDSNVEVYYKPNVEQYEAIFELNLNNYKMEKNYEKVYKKHNGRRYLEAEPEYDEEEHREQITKKFEWLQNEKVYQHVAKFEIKPEVVKMEVEAVCNNDFHFCKTQIRGEELKATIQYVYPQTPRTVEELKEQKYRQLVVMGEMNYGENTIHININGQQSQEQKKFVKQIEQAPEHETLLEASRLDQYQTVVEYEFEPKPAQYFARYWNMVQAYLRTQYPWTSRIETREEPSRKNMIRATINVEPRQRLTVNMTIETPMETTVLERVELPFRLPTAQIHYQPRNSRYEQKPVMEKIAHHASKQANCVVKSTKINTFDQVAYRNQFTPCYSVLAKDCGSEKSEPRFVVLMKKINEKKEWKNVKVVYGENEIEMYKTEEGLICRVNGEEIEYQPESEIEKKQYNIIWLNKNTLKFDSDDVTVQFDGVNARIHLSALYRNQQCGLCGHYDNEKETEFYDAENQENTIPKFAKSYLYKDSKCNYEREMFEKEENFQRIEKNQEEEKDQEMNYEESRREQDDEPTEQVAIVERQHEICFTQKPVLPCQNGKSQESKKQKVTSVYCLPSSNSWARRQMREIRREPLAQWPEHNVRNLRDQPQMEERTVRVAVDQKCDKFDY
nr:vitellogenin:ISOTYPE=6 [Caenorhabditis elegans]